MSRASVMDLNDAAPGTRARDYDGDIWVKKTDGMWRCYRDGKLTHTWSSSSLSGLDVTILPERLLTLRADFGELPVNSVVQPDDARAPLRFTKLPHGGWVGEGTDERTAYTASGLLSMRDRWLLVERGPEPHELTLDQAWEQHEQEHKGAQMEPISAFVAGWFAAGGK